MTESWYRVTTVQVGDLLFDSEECDIEFKVTKSSDSSQNTAEIILWNLGESSLNAITTDQAVRIKAGYQEDYGEIFEGTVTEKEPEPDGADLSTIITCSDASRDLYESEKFTVQVWRGQELSTAAAEVFSTCDIPVGQIDVSDYTFPHAQTFVGTGQEILEDLLKIVDDYTAYTEGGMGYFVRSDHQTAEVFEINSSTGLLSAEKTEDTTSETSAKITTLLNWKIRVDAWLKVESPSVSGYYKVSKYTHSCKGDKYETEMDVTPA